MGAMKSAIMHEPGGPSLRSRAVRSPFHFGGAAAMAGVEHSRRSASSDPNRHILWLADALWLGHRQEQLGSPDSALAPELSAASVGLGPAAEGPRQKLGDLTCDGL
jgi:hypothetical protein